MTRGLRIVLAASALCGPLAASSWAENVAWLHVRVEEPHRDSRVSVNLPLSVVEAALRAAPEKIACEGRIHLGRHEGPSVCELRRLWKELRATGDAELVSIDAEDETVRVARAGDLVQLRVTKAGRREQVRVDLPVSLVDALLSGDDEGLDLAAALVEVRKLRGEIVRVSDDREGSVRVWIDEQN